MDHEGVLSSTHKWVSLLTQGIRNWQQRYFVCWNFCIESATWGTFRMKGVASCLRQLEASSLFRADYVPRSVHSWLRGSSLLVKIYFNLMFGNWRTCHLHRRFSFIITLITNFDVSQLHMHTCICIDVLWEGSPYFSYKQQHRTILIHDCFYYLEQ